MKKLTYVVSAHCFGFRFRCGRGSEGNGCRVHGGITSSNKPMGGGPSGRLGGIDVLQFDADGHCCRCYIRRSGRHEGRDTCLLGRSEGISSVSAVLAGACRFAAHFPHCVHGSSQ